MRFDDTPRRIVSGWLLVEHERHHSWPANAPLDCAWCIHEADTRAADMAAHHSAQVQADTDRAHARATKTRRWAARLLFAALITVMYAAPTTTWWFLPATATALALVPLALPHPKETP